MEGNAMMTKEQTTIINSLRSQGFGYKRIADRTGISANTIKSYLRRIDLPVTVASVSSDSHICKNCGAAVQQTIGRKEKKFCSDKCRNQWWNAHSDLIRRKAFYPFTCAHCGKETIAYGDAHRKYCSHKCYLADRFGGGEHETIERAISE